MTGRPPGPSRRARAWRLAAGAALALVVGLFLARRLVADWRSVSMATFHLRPAPLALAFVLQTAGWLLVVDTWRRIVGRLAGDVPFAEHLRLYAYTALTHVLPGSVWTPASRVALYRARALPGLGVAAAVVVEWLLLGLGGVVLYALSAPFAMAVPPASTPWLLAAGALAIAVLRPATFARLGAFAARRLGRPADVPRLGARALAAWFARELVVLALSGVALFLVMGAVTDRASLPDAMAAWALAVAVANLLAWLPLTALVKDAGMALLLAPVYDSTATAVIVVAVWRLWSALLQLAWAGLATIAARGVPGPASDASAGLAAAPEPEEGAWTT